MTPIEKKAMLILLRDIRACIINMENSKTDYNEIAYLDGMAVALDRCIDTFEHIDD